MTLVMAGQSGVMGLLCWAARGAAAKSNAADAMIHKRVM